MTNNKEHIGSTFDSWLKEQGIEIDDEEIKHRIRINLNKVRNELVKAYEEQCKTSPEEAEVKWKKDIAEWNEKYFRPMEYVSMTINLSPESQKVLKDLIKDPYEQELEEK